MTPIQEEALAPFPCRSDAACSLSGALAGTADATKEKKGKKKTSSSLVCRLFSPPPHGYGPCMGLVVLLLVLALLFGGLGLFVEGLKWLLIIALVLFVVGAFTGYRGRGTGAPPP